MCNQLPNFTGVESLGFVEGVGVGVAIGVTATLILVTIGCIIIGLVWKCCKKPPGNVTQRLQTLHVLPVCVQLFIHACTCTCYMCRYC